MNRSDALKRLKFSALVYIVRKICVVVLFQNLLGHLKKQFHLFKRKFDKVNAPVVGLLRAFI